MKEALKYTIESLPHKPGVYQFFNIKDEIIYVGKAKDLKRRVSSYFNRNNYDSAKLRILVSKIENIKYILVGTESDALLLEKNLIKNLKPRYNILLKDDKTYPWICIKNEPFPRLFSTRRYVNDGSSYFGPYTSGVLLKILLELIKNLYPLRNCNLVLSKANLSSSKYKACLEYQLGNCLAPCEGRQTEDEYNENIKAIKEILNGNLQLVKQLLKEQMKVYARDYKYEDAHRTKIRIDMLDRYQSKSAIVNPKLKDIDVISLVINKYNAFANYIKVNNGLVIQSHNFELKLVIDESPSDILLFIISEIKQRNQKLSPYVIVPFKPEYKLDDIHFLVPTKGEKLKLLELSERNAKSFSYEVLQVYEKQDPMRRLNRILDALQRDFRTKEKPILIECFDNSNLQGTNPVSVCVVFVNAKPSKKEYRLYNIKTVQGPDDFATMREVMYRRYSKGIKNSNRLPNLIVIDGGKGQLSSAYQVLKDIHIEEKVQIVGIAKRLEEIYFPNDSIPLYLDKNSESLKVIQNIRNEAHRFSLKHHRNKRSNTFLESELEKIQGIGPKTIKALFLKFKSKEKIFSASKEELIDTIGKAKTDILLKYIE